MLQQEHPEHEAHRLRRTALVGKISRQLIVEPDPVDPVGQDDKRVLHVDDLVEAGAEEVVMPRFLLLFRSHVIPQLQYRQRITNGPENISQIARKLKTTLSCKLNYLKPAKTLRTSTMPGLFTGILICCSRSQSSIQRHRAGS